MGEAYGKNITDLQTTVRGSAGSLTFTSYIDGSTGWDKLKGTSGVTDTDTEAKYPAWYYCKKYGTANNLPAAMQTGWYFPSVAELFDIWKEKTSVEASLTAAGGDTFSTNIYWSSSQYASTAINAIALRFGSGNSREDAKDFDGHYVCAVRAFTY